MEKALNDLYQDYLDLGLKYQNRLPIHEFCHALIAFNAKIILDCAPTETTAVKTIDSGVKTGIQLHKRDCANVKRKLE